MITYVAKLYKEHFELLIHKKTEFINLFVMHYQHLQSLLYWSLPPDRGYRHANVKAPTWSKGTSLSNTLRMGTTNFQVKDGGGPTFSHHLNFIESNSGRCLISRSGSNRLLSPLYICQKWVEICVLKPFLVF